MIEGKTVEIRDKLEEVESLKYELKSTKKEIEHFKVITSFLAAEKLTETAQPRSRRQTK